MTNDTTMVTTKIIPSLQTKCIERRVTHLHVPFFVFCLPGCPSVCSFSLKPLYKFVFVCFCSYVTIGCQAGHLETCQVLIWKTGKKMILIIQFCAKKQPFYLELTGIMGLYEIYAI